MSIETEEKEGAAETRKKPAEKHLLGPSGNAIPKPMAQQTLFVDTTVPCQNVSAMRADRQERRKNRLLQCIEDVQVAEIEAHQHPRE